MVGSDDAEDEGIGVVERVHIAPLGFEKDRILNPALEYNADRVVLIQHEKDHELKDYHETMVEELKAAGVSVTIERADIFRLYSSIGTIASLIQKYGGHNVYVNLASGSKVSAVGGMIACMAEDATPYYVRAESYEYDEEEKPISAGMRDTLILPAYPIDQPKPEHILILQQLESRGPLPKKDVIAVGKEYNLPFVQHIDSDSGRAEYRRLDAHIINPLLEDGYVEIEEVGQRRLVHITDSGRKTLEAFEYLAREADNLPT